MDTRVQYKPVDSNQKETTEAYFNSTLLDDGALFSSHTINTLSLIGLENNNNNNHNKKTPYNNTNIDTTNNYENLRYQEPVNSTEVTQGSDSLNTTHSFLTNVNTPLPRSQRRKSFQFDTEPVNI